MKPTEEQIKEIEREAREYAKKSTAPDKETPDWIITDYIAGATAQLERFPCSPEEAMEAIDLLKRQNDANDYDGHGPVIELRIFLNKLK